MTYILDLIYVFIGGVKRHGIRALTSKITYLEAVVLSKNT